MTKQPLFDLTNHGLKNPELVTRIYTHILSNHAVAPESMWQFIVEFDQVKSDIRSMDAIIEGLRFRGESDEVIYKTVIDRVYGRTTTH